MDKDGIFSLGLEVGEGALNEFRLMVDENKQRIIVLNKSQN